MIPAEYISARVAALADEINAHFAGSEKLIVVGLLRGSFVFIADLVRRLDLPARHPQARPARGLRAAVQALAPRGRDPRPLDRLRDSRRIRRRLRHRLRPVEPQPAVYRRGGVRLSPLAPHHRPELGRCVD
jgi:hypothetical protein